VIILSEKELSAFSQKVYHIHGINLPEALVLNRRLGMPLPDRLYLIGIEIGHADEFGETLSDELRGKFDEIYDTVLAAVYRLLPP